MTARAAAVPLAVLLAAACGPARSTSPLIAAARSGDITTLNSLLRAGADPNQTGGVNGWNALQHAVHKNQIHSVAALLAAGAGPNSPGLGRMTPLMMAAGYGQNEIVRLLLDKGANPRLRNPQGQSAVDLALSGTTDIDSFTAGRCQPTTVQALLEAAPDTRPSPAGVSKLLSLVQGKAGCDQLRQILLAPR